MRDTLLCLAAIAVLAPMAASAASAGSPATTAGPAAADDQLAPTYWEEGFDDLDRWTSQHAPVEQVTWRPASTGAEGDLAATIGHDGLPGGFHTALASDRIDLTPMPAAPAPSEQAIDKLEALDTAGDADEAVRSAQATTGTMTNIRLDTGSEEPITTGTIEVPEGPAYLSVLHRFHFEDVREEDGDALAGFTVEAREAGGEWTTLEPTTIAQTARGTQVSPSEPGLEAQEVNPEALYQAFTEPLVGFDGESLDPCHAVDQAGALAQALVGAGRSNCTAERFVVPGSDTAEDPLLTLGESVSFRPVQDQTGQPYPALHEAYVAPLEAHGYTGTSGDRDEDGQPDLVGWTFDLGPWAGETVELRFRAAADTGVATDDGLWAIDHAQIQAAARPADLSLELTHPDADDLAAPAEGFPITAQVQNVGLADQQGPFPIEVTVRSPEGTVLTQETVEAEGTLGFLDTAQARLVLPITSPRGPLQVDARLELGQADADPRNDADRARLAVATDRSAEIDIQSTTPRVATGEPVDVTVTVENTGNVPLTDTLTLAAHPHDPDTETAAVDPLTEPVMRELTLDRSPERHPDGSPAASDTVTVTLRIDEPGPVQLHASFANATATQGLGVEAPPPAELTVGFADVDAGPASFELTADGTDWQARPASDVRQLPGGFEPGSVDGQAWAPSKHDSTLVRPQGGQDLLDGEQAPPSVGSRLCLAQLFVIPETCPANVGETEAGTPIVLESPRGTQRVHAMAHEVPLHEADEAQLSFLSSLVGPDEERGVQEARVYVATDEDLRSLATGCPSAEDPGQDAPVNTDPCRIVNVLGVDEAADQAIEQTFFLEESLRCSLPYAAGELAGRTITRTTCPHETGDTSGTCLATGGITQGSGVACTPDERSQLEALAPMLTGTLVHRETVEHPWQRTTIDLDAWTGENVTIGIAYVAESDEATHERQATPQGKALGLPLDGPPFSAFTDRLSGTLGYEAPGHAQGGYLVERVQVRTDDGLALAPEATDRDHAHPAGTAEDNRPGHADTGWRTLGYEHRTDLRQDGLPGTSAQVMTGAGFSPAPEADPSAGLQLGVPEDGQRGVELYPTRLHQTVKQSARQAAERSPGQLDAPDEDPAVTVLASPTLDLTSMEEPVLRLRQAFDLATRGGPQGVTDELSPEEAVDAMGLSADSAERCQLGDRNSRLPRSAPLTLVGLGCLLEDKRAQQSTFDAKQAAGERVGQPDVAAGLFVQARTIGSEQLEGPRVVEPRQGYRYPIDDPGGFQPTLGYTVSSPDAFPGYTLGQDDEAANQATDTEHAETRFAGTPVWAGDSDVDGDGEADWVTNELDLSAFAGEQIQLEFVLVARQNADTPNPRPSGDDGTLLSQRPWSLDGLEVIEADEDGQTAIEAIDWPDPQRPLAEPGEPLPVQFDATTPTGVEGNLYGQALLFDDEGCLRGQATTNRTVDLAPGETAELSTSFDASDVDGPTPWTLELATDVDQPPAQPTPATVATRASPDADRTEITRSLVVDDGSRLHATVEDPGCQPDPRVVAVSADDDAPEPTIHDVDADTVEVQAQDGDLIGDIQHEADGRPTGLAVIEGQGSRAGLQAETLRFAANGTTIDVHVAERVPAGLPTTVELTPAASADQAHLWTLDPADGSLEHAWTGPLDAPGTETVTLALDEGPQLLVATAATDEGSTALGLAGTVASPGETAGDPLREDDQAQLTVSAGQRTELAVTELDATPREGLTTDARELSLTARNQGTATLHGVDVSLTADGETLAHRNVTLSPGERETIHVDGFHPDEASTLVRGQASHPDAADAAAEPLRALVPVGNATFTDAGDGWRIDNDTARFQTADGQAPADTTGELTVDPGLSTGVTGLVARLNHSLAMEPGFDGGQARIAVDDEQVRLASPDRAAVNELAPIEGPALTGTIEDPTRLRIPAASELAEDQRLVDGTAVDQLGTAVLDASEDPVPERGYATCEDPTFADSATSTSGQARCSFVDPLIPAPQSAVDRGIFHLQPAEFLSSEATWTVEGEDETYRVTAEEATSFVFLEAGRDLVAAAQDQGSLTIAFDEARMLAPFTGSADFARPMSVEVCARFMHASDDAVDSLPPERRCTGLTHEEGDQRAERDWSRTILRVADIPQAPAEADERYNVVRIELSLQEDRSDRRGTGLMGPHEDGREAYKLDDPVKGWFVGPVTAEAGDTAKTWTPDQDALTNTDPNTGRNASELSAELDTVERPNPIASLPPEEPIEQSATIGLTEVTVEQLDEEGQVTSVDTVSTVAGYDEDARPQFDPPLVACAWHQAPDCEATDILEAYASEGSNWDADSSSALVGMTAPFAMNLTCALPGQLDAAGLAGTRGCATSADLPGMGVQVLNATTIQEGDSDTCASDEGPPVLWRTRCLHVRRATPGSHSDTYHEEAEGDSLVFTNTHATEGEPVPMRSRGHSLDYRLVVPVDLRYAADGADAWASPQMTEAADIGGSIQDLRIDYLAEARIQGQEDWQRLDKCTDQQARHCVSAWTGVDRYDQIDLGAFAGHEIELAIRVQHPHPMLTADELDDREAVVALDGIDVQADFLPVTEPDLTLTAGTDISREHEGWRIDDVQLYGLPVGANVGVDRLESKLAIEDSDGRELHVHANPRAEPALFMSAPANITVYNQGEETLTLPLDATLEGRADDTGWIASGADDWTKPVSEGGMGAPDGCEAQLERTDTDTDTVELGPGEAERVPIRATFVPASADQRLHPADVGEDHHQLLGECFPEMFDDGDGELQDTGNRAFRLSLNVSGGPEDDHVVSDDRLRIDVRPNPFLEGHDGFTGIDEAHQQRFAIADTSLSPTRPSGDQAVELEANLTLVDRSHRPLDAELSLVDPATDEVLATANLSEAEDPVSVLEPYRSTSLAWTLDETPEEATLVRLAAEIAQGGEAVQASADAWLAPDVGPHVDRHDPDELQLAGDAERQDGPEGTVVQAERSDDEALEAAIGTGWLELGASPPPLVTVRADWTFPADVWDEREDRPDQVLDGWAVQVCSVDGTPSEGDCPISTDASGDSGDGRWAWRTVDVVQAPEGTLATALGDDPRVAPPGGDCGRDGQLRVPPNEQGAERCSAQAADWPNVLAGDDLVTDASRSAEPWRTVTARLDTCSTSAEGPGCPDWGTEDRHETIRVRLVALGADGSGEQRLTVKDVTLTPVGLQAQALDQVSLPAGVEKAVPVELARAGDVGVHVDGGLQLPEGYEGRLQAPDLVEDAATARAIVDPGPEPGTVEAVLDPREPETAPTRTPIEVDSQS